MKYKIRLRSKDEKSIQQSKLTDKYELKTNILGELKNNIPHDNPIPIPTIKKMKFKLGKSTPKEFSV